MKKKIIPIIILMVVLLVTICTMSAYALKNKYLLEDMIERLTTAIEEAQSVELIEVQSVYGKLNGNGNGIQYYGTVLVKTSSEDNVKEIVESLSDQYEELNYCIQESGAVQSKYLEHVTVEYEYSLMESEEEYYSIYFYVSHHENSNLLDIDGH